jgi:predicted transcriptional regulator YheO
MVPISVTAKVLNISKPTLYRWMKRLDVQTTQSGSKKLISDTDIERIRTAITDDRKSSDYSQYILNDIDSVETESKQVPPRVKKQSSGTTESDHIQQLLAEKDRQIQRLEDLLNREQISKKELEQGVLSMQGQMFRIHALLEQQPKQSFWSRLIGR